MPVRAGLPAATSHCCTDEKSILGIADIPFPLQQPPKPAAEPGSTWMEVAEPSVPLQLFLGIKAVERSKTSSVLQDAPGGETRHGPGVSPRQAAPPGSTRRFGLVEAPHGTGVGSFRLLPWLWLRREKGQWLL